MVRLLIVRDKAGFYLLRHCLYDTVLIKLATAVIRICDYSESTIIIAGYFRGTKFSWIAQTKTFRGF